MKLIKLDPTTDNSALTPLLSTIDQIKNKGGNYAIYLSIVNSLRALHK